MLNAKCLKLWRLLPDSPPQQIHGTLQPGAWCSGEGRLGRSAGGQAVPEERWMTLHPLLFIATHRANLPAATDSSAPPPAPQEGWNSAGEAGLGELRQLEQHSRALYSLR